MTTYESEREGFDIQESPLPYFVSERRNKLEQILDVLLSIRSGNHKITRVMHSCNLPWTTTKEVLAFLESRALVSFDFKRTYNSWSIVNIQTTERGEKLLANIYRIMRETGIETVLRSELYLLNPVTPP